MKNGAVTPLRSHRPMDEPGIQRLYLLFFAWEQTQLFRSRCQAKISSEKIISSAWLFREFIRATQAI